MRCEEVDLLLDDYLDGTLAEGDAAAVAAHLERCEACRTIAADLRSILHDAGALSGIEPARDLWPEIERVVGSRKWLGLGSVTRFRQAPRGRALLAAAAMLVVGAGAVLVGMAIGRRSVPAAPSAAAGRGAILAAASADVGSARAGLDAARAQLRAALQAQRARFSPATFKVIEHNLAVIDEAARQIEKALSADPGNPGLEQLLMATYRQEIDMLQLVTQSPARG